MADDRESGHSLPLAYATAVDDSSEHHNLLNNNNNNSSGRDTDGVNSSDGGAGSPNELESRGYLLRLRFCSLVDVVGLVYRSALPAFCWANYFASCASLGPMLQLTYLAFKLYEFSWKSKGAVLAGYNFFGNKLVRRKYVRFMFCFENFSKYPAIGITVAELL